MSLTPQDLIKIQQVVKEETKDIPQMKAAIFRLEEGMNDLKDIFLQFKRQYDEDYGLFGLRLVGTEERTLRNSRDILHIKKKLNLN